MCDSHTHLTTKELSQDLSTFLKNYADAGGESLLNVAYHFESIYEVLKQHEKFNQYSGIEVKIAIGIHPELFYSNSYYDKTYSNYKSAEKAIKLLRELFERHEDKISAVGETGLDYHELLYDTQLTATQKGEEREIQKWAFRQHLEIARKKILPLTIHIRDKQGDSFCTEDALQLVGEVGNGNLTGSFHSYTGDVKYVDDILNLGMYIGFNGIITYNSAENVREILKMTPPERILLETDAPYLPPNSIRNNKKLTYRQGQPSDIFVIAEKIGEVKGMSVDEVLLNAKRNYSKLFGKV